VTTSALKLGERGWFEVGYDAENPGGTVPAGTIVIGRGKKILFQGVMAPAVTPDGHPGFAIQGNFRVKKLAGGLSASITVSLDRLRSQLFLQFSLARG
jgi:hypothetical protein